MKRIKNNAVNQWPAEKVFHHVIKDMVTLAVYKREVPNMAWSGKEVVRTEAELQNGTVDVLDINRKIAWEIQIDTTEKEDNKKRYYMQNREVDTVKIIKETLFPPGYREIIEAAYEIIKKEVDKLP